MFELKYFGIHITIIGRALFLSFFFYCFSSHYIHFLNFVYQTVMSSISLDRDASLSYGIPFWILVVASKGKDLRVQMFKTKWEAENDRDQVLQYKINSLYEYKTNSKYFRQTLLDKYKNESTMSRLINDAISEDDFFCVKLVEFRAKLGSHIWIAISLDPKSEPPCRITCHLNLNSATELQRTIEFEPYVCRLNISNCTTEEEEFFQTDDEDGELKPQYVQNSNIIKKLSEKLIIKPDFEVREFVVKQ